MKSSILCLLLALPAFAQETKTLAAVDGRTAILSTGPANGDKVIVR